MAQNGVPQINAAPNDVNKPVVVTQANIRSFDVSRPIEWPRWVKLLKFNFTAMHITDSKLKRAQLFTICGESLYKLTCNVLHPSEVDAVEFDQIIEKLISHFQSQVNEVAPFYRFSSLQPKIRPNCQ